MKAKPTFSTGSKTTYKIRKGRIHDIPRLIELGEAMRLESKVYFPPIDQEAVWKNARVIIENPDRFCLFVAEAEQVFGWIDGFLSQFWVFSEDPVAAHDIFFVHPDYRKKYPYAALKLIKAFKEWAAPHRAIIRVDTGLNPERTGKLYRRLGFEPMGGQYIS